MILNFFSATFLPSIAADTIPPAYPAPSINAAANKFICCKLIPRNYHW